MGTGRAVGAVVLLTTLLHAQGPRVAPMEGGGDVSITRSGDTLRVSVTGPRAGLASLCIADDTRVRILHASAAVGEAVYRRDGERWVLQSGFDWKLRDSRKTSVTEADRQRVLRELGWVANPSNAGDPVREFTIRVSDDAAYLGVTFFTTSDPMTVSHWPSSMDDGCREVKVAQGYLPDVVQFRPSTWYRLGQ